MKIIKIEPGDHFPIKTTSKILYYGIKCDMALNEGDHNEVDVYGEEDSKFTFNLIVGGSNSLWESYGDENEEMIYRGFNRNIYGGEYYEDY